MKLLEAKSLARRIVEALAPLCERIEVAGSIRRGRPEVNDIDLVLWPHPGRLPEICARCQRHAQAVVEGDQNATYRLPLNGGRVVQLDLYFARPPVRDLFQTRPSNWGSLLLCRTGSKEHNIWLIEQAKRLGLKWRPYDGVFDADGHCIAGAEEPDIFAALGLPWIRPELREITGCNTPLGP